MPKFSVTIRATVTKTLEVEADSEDEAAELAHQEFTTESEEGESERYEQDTLRIELADS